MDDVKKNKGIIHVFIILFSLLGVGWYASWDDIKKTADSVVSVKADFVQRKIMKILSRPLVSRGKFYFHSPRSLRWEYTSPVTSVLLLHSGTIARYVKGEDGYVKDAGAGLQAMQVVVQEISQWVKGEFDANPRFRSELRGGGRIVLTPREKSLSKIISRIEIVLSKTPGVIESVRVIESEDSYTLLRFENVVVNAAMDQTLFEKL